MKNDFKKFLLFIVISIVFPLNMVSAGNFNSNAGSSTVGYPGGSSNWKPISPYFDSYSLGVRYTLVKYDGNSFKNIGHKDIWISRTNAKSYYGISKILNLTDANYNYMTYTSNSYYNYNYSGIAENNFFFKQTNYPNKTISKSAHGVDYSIYKDNGLFYYNWSAEPNLYDSNTIYKTEENKEYIKKHMETWFGVSYDQVMEEAAKGNHIGSDKCREGYLNEGSSFKCKGYRILIEPLHEFVVWSKEKGVMDETNIHALTISEAVKLYNKLVAEGCPKSGGIGVEAWFSAYAKMLYTSYDDVGITAGKNYSGDLVDGLSSLNVGLGLNIIDPTFGEVSKCEHVEKYLEDEFFKRNPILTSVWNNIIKNNHLRDPFILEFKTKINNGSVLYTDDFGKDWTYTDYANECLLGVSCEMVENSNKNIKSDLQRASDLGNINLFKTLYPRDISYVDNNGNPGTVTASWYINNCPPTVNGKYNCTPEYGVNGCLSGDDIYYKDGGDKSEDYEYWDNCVFNDNGDYSIYPHKVSKPKIGGSLSHYDKSLGGNYCEVYCVEELSTNFGKSVRNVQAGNHFLWMNHSVSGSRTCKTKEIDWDRYLYDVDRANADVKDDYINWQLEILASKVKWSKSSTEDCNYKCVSYGHHWVKCHCKTSEDGKKSCDSCYRSYCKKYAYTDYYYTPSKSSVSFWGDSIHFRRTCGTKGYHPNVSSKKRIYNRSLDVAAGVTNEMTKCYDWNASNIYNLNPELSIRYSDNTYTYGDSLKTNTHYNHVSTDSDCVKVTAPNYTGCSGTNCYKNSSVYKCGYNNETRSATSNFDFSKKGVFQYVLKNNNKSFHSYELGSETLQNITTNYIDVGYSNFPVAYKTPNGIYGFESPNGGELSLTYKKLGHMISGSTALDSILSQKPVDMNDNYGKWQCEFSVSSNLITGEDDSDKNAGINLIYRSIDLDHPFPGMDASGRNTGNNWCFFGNCNNNNQNVKDAIKNNRGVKGDEVYHKEPMYSFTLTPADINNIREYNKKNSYTEYTGSLDGETYDFVCNKGTGKNCISEYLTELIKMSGTGGTCSSRKARNNSLNSGFESCRY